MIQKLKQIPDFVKENLFAAILITGILLLITVVVLVAGFEENRAQKKEVKRAVLKERSDRKEDSLRHRLQVSKEIHNFYKAQKGLRADSMVASAARIDSLQKSYEKTYSAPALAQPELRGYFAAYVDSARRAQRLRGFHGR